MRTKIDKPNWWAVIISTAITITGFSVNYYIFHRNYDQAQEAKMNDKLDIIYNLEMSYPYVEDSSFIAKYCNQKLANNDSLKRYAIYCEKVFNFMQDVAEYYDYNKNSIDNFVNIDYYLNTHKCWWQNEDKNPLNTKDYPKRFIDFVNSYIVK